MDEVYIKNIITLKEFMKNDNNSIDYAGISSYDDFQKYESIIPFKYKVVDNNLQLTKVCNFINNNKETLDYDWYIKYRPELKLLHKINFQELCSNSINCRAWSYKGPKKILFGTSTDYTYSSISEEEGEIVVDDQLYIFNNNIIEMDSFNKDKFIDTIKYRDNLKTENESTHTLFWKSKNVKINIISLDMIFTRTNYRSGHINIM
jgi:hypothetical protein